MPTADQARIELRSRGSFTDRVAPFASIHGLSATMRQPSWDNNTWGWDTIDKPLPDDAHRTLRLENALALLDQEGEWFFDPAASTLYYKPPSGVDPNGCEIVAPMTQTLISICGRGPDSKVVGLRFEGLSFQYVSDITPNSDDGYANQQNGAFIAGRLFALRDPRTGDLPTLDHRVFDGHRQSPLVRLIRCAEDGRARYIDDNSAVDEIDLPRLIDLRDHPTLPLNTDRLKAWNAANPDDQKTDCSLAVYPETCVVFEANRGFFQQSAAAVQLSAAASIDLVGNTFAHLGSNALGVGNDACANHSGIGLGAQNIRILDNSFIDIAGSAIVVGGISEHAHHPDVIGDRNARITISDNRIHGVAKGYLDRSAILITYVDGAEITHNELSQGAYDAIDSGWGWGVFDNGGNPTYQGRGAYLFTPRYADDEPTVNRNIRIAHNVIWDFKQQGADGGVLYNLGSTPGSCWDSNYVLGERGYKLYFDEGTRFMIARDNVLSEGATWTFANGFVDTSSTPARGQANNTTDNTVDGTIVLGPGFNEGPWSYDSGARDPGTEGLYRNRITTRSQIGVAELPLTAQRVIAEAGVRPELRRAGDWVGQPRGLELSLSRNSAGEQILSAVLVNLGSGPLTSVAVRASASEGIYLRPLVTAPESLAPGEARTATWLVSGAAPIVEGSVAVTTDSRAGGADAVPGTAGRTLPVLVGAGLDPSLRVAGFATYVEPQAVRSGSTMVLLSSGRDIGVGGDEFTAVFTPGGLEVQGSITVRVDTIGGSFYRSGLAVRNDLSRFADAAVEEKSLGYAVLLVEPEAIALRVDGDGDGVIDTEIARSSTRERPLWLRLTRSADLVSAHYSTDGDLYIELCRDVRLVGAQKEALDAGIVHSSADRRSVDARGRLTTSTAVFADLTFARS